ncbi:group 1 glycosyl transferase [Melaminivora suipulveris]|uniref:Group 1 glycosyl transferase n=1 Tax=Melaminivora suipulveris TaxID=2109913 RepID=A0A2R3QA76_9BURK|nr:glycosyltransferase [Melaminivora suipulveris]AVO48659.1 group 1 glycosyl transferase [Melaminivora suipulveris]
MKIALIAPSGVPFVVGGAEKLWWGLSGHVNRHTPHAMELIKLPSPEHDFWSIAESYERWSLLDLDHFDAVISTKYPAWLLRHPNHVVYLQHTLRGLYDTYPAHLPVQPTRLPAVAQKLWRLLEGAGSERALLPEIFAQVRALRQGAGLAPEALAALTALPGPLVRALVHRLDAIALAPGAIRSYFAISGVVARREGYFPKGAQVTVLPHPSNLEGLHGGPQEFVFTASRLDAPKRLDLLVRAYRRTRAAMPLRIAGDGPERERLQALAAGDARIRFTGRLNDDALVEHYSRAALVPFIPYDEDMGLITLEAMGSGKPVLTVSDAGGVTEFVQDGVNGRVVPPDEAALAQALDEMLAQPARLAQMGRAAQGTAAQVTWERTAAGLLDAAAAGLRPAPAAADAAAPAPRAQPQRLRLLVLNTFGAYPPDSGGSKRLFYLAQGLAQWADVTLLTLGAAGGAAQQWRFGGHFREVRVPPSPRFVEREQALTRALRQPVTDVAALLYHGELREMRQAFGVLSAQADVVVAAHVYLAPLAFALWHGPVWYDAHNVEADMKAMVLAAPLLGPGTALPAPDRPLDLRAGDAAQQAVARVAAAEAQLVQRAERVWAVSETNRTRLAQLYGRAAERIEVVPNGTQIPADAWLGAERRAALKQQLGWGARPLALFVASYHGPNLVAADAVLALAGQCPQWNFALVGSVCNHVRGRAQAANVRALGVLPEAGLTALLRAADVGLNPMASGSGTNLKMLDYAGHGLLALSTAVGARGLALEAGRHFVQSELEDFTAALARLAPLAPAPEPELRAAARALVERTYAWGVIAQSLQPSAADAGTGMAPAAAA